jgi:hypothetical protein
LLYRCARQIAEGNTMTHASTTITCTCQHCGGEFESPTHDIRGRKRTAGQIAQLRFCPKPKPCARQAGSKAQTENRRAALGKPIDKDARKGRGLSPHTIEQLDAVRAILDSANPISVRSCCYHLLSVGLLSSTKDFANMQSKITHARIRESNDEPNSLPDNCFVDHSRVLEFWRGSPDVNSFIASMRKIYARDPWQDQPTVPIILCEKRGHGDILKTVCDAAHVRLFLSKGVHARSFLNTIADACAEIISNGQNVSLGYLGDFDCSGLQMEIAAENGNVHTGTRKREGLRQLLANKHYITDTTSLTWTRLALTKKQFQKLPKKARVPVKETYTDDNGELVRGDNNAKAYVAEHGKFGGEVEALGFEGMQKLVSDFIDAQKNPVLWEIAEATEKDEVNALSNLQL